MSRQVLARLVWSASLLAVAACGVAPAYAGRLVGLPTASALVVAAILLAMAVVAAAAWLRLPRWTVALGVALLTSVALAVATSDLLDALPRLLTAPRPAPPTAAYLAPTLAVVFVTSVVAGLSETRPRASGGVSPALAALLYLLAAVLTAGRGDHGGLLAAVLLVLTLAGWTLLPRYAAGSARPVSARPRGATARAAVAACAAALVVAPLAMTGTVPKDAFDPRSLVDTPRQDAEVLSPLPMLAVWADQTDIPLVGVQGTVPARLTLAVLPDFDGASWANRGRFTVPGAEPEPDLPVGASTVPYDVRIRVDALTGGWMPSAGRPTSLDTDDVRVDADSGALIDLRGLREGQTYHLAGVVTAAREERLATAAVPAQEDARRYLRTPQLPRTFAQYARTGVTKATTRLEQAVALEELVRSGRSFSAKAPSGSSYAELEQFLFPRSGSAVGTSEQFAASYVLLARSIGLPSRLVVGMQVPEGATSPVTLTGGTVQAWPEVYFSGVGWVPFDPTPTETGRARSAPRQQVLDRLGESAHEDKQQGTDTARSTPRGGTTHRDQPLSTRDRALLVAGGAGGLAVLGLLALAVARWSRRRRLRRLGAIGAWQQQVDALVLAGRPPAAPDSSTLIADRLRDAHPDLGDAPVVLLARAEQAAYGPSPGSRTDDSWQQAVAITTAVRRAAPWWRRVTWWFDPRVLRGRSGD